MQRYDDFKLIGINCHAACHGKTEHCIFVKFKKPAKLLSVSPSRVLRAPSTSLYHLVPKHHRRLRATLPRPEQSHLLPEACSPDGTIDNRGQLQRRTECLLNEPSDILKRWKKVSKLYYLFNPSMHSVLLKASF